VQKIKSVGRPWVSDIHRLSEIVRAACRYSKSTSVNASSSQFTRDVKDKCNILQKKVNKSLPRSKAHLSAELTENSINIRLRSKFMVPLRLAKAAANPMNSSEAFKVADSDFVR
jgi:hypothetical protein